MGALACEQYPQMDAKPQLRLLWLLTAALAALGAFQIAVLCTFQPLGIDFLPLWTAGRIASAHPAEVYDFAAITDAQRWLLPHIKWMRPYAYPPTALLFLAPLGALPFWLALSLWTATGLGVFLYAGARLTQRRLGLSLLLMAFSPAVVLALVAGQSVMLAAGLAALAMLDLDQRPRRAGALLALAAAIKPQAALLAPVALVAGGASEALASAALVETLLVAASVILFGFGRWHEWLASLPAFQTIVETTPGLIPGVITPAGAAYGLGLAGPAAMVWRAAFALGGGALVWRAFARKVDVATRLAALAAGSLLAAPYAMHYDGALLVAAAVALVIAAEAQKGWMLRLTAFVFVCGVTAPGLGFLAVVAFAVLVWRDGEGALDVGAARRLLVGLDPGKT